MRCPHCGHPNIDDCRTSKNKVRRTSCLVREVVNLKKRNKYLVECAEARNSKLAEVLLDTSQPTWPGLKKELANQLY
jgi:hypothetical protein